ncbi:hypothetical protein TAMYLO_300001 [Tenacibaculum amylolyticum]
MRAATTNIINASDWKYRIYYVTGGTANLHSSTKTSYFEDKAITTQTNYFYDYPNHYQLKRTEFTDSKGDVYKTIHDFDTGLINANRMMPVTTTSYKNNTQLSKQHTVYGTDTSSSLYVPKRIQTAKGSQVLEDRAVFHKYDTKGNPVEVSKQDGTKIYYVWGYEKSQPIAKIEGYNSISSSQEIAINNAISVSNSDINTTTESTLRDRLTIVRAAFPEAQVTSFTYDPLVGVTSITDPRGETIYYSYDLLNRLILVKNSAGEILKEHQYNYKN